MKRAPSTFAVVFNALSPGSALDVDEDPGGRVLQLHHDDGLKVTQLVPVGKEIGRESSPIEVIFSTN